LFTEGFDDPSTLIDITSADLKASGLKIAIAQSLSNLLAKDNQPNGELRFCIVLYCIILYSKLASNAKVIQYLFNVYTFFEGKQ
jgi:hypothetical protein